MQNRQCPYCGAVVLATERFCGECGRAVDAPAAPPAAFTPAPPAYYAPPPPVVQPAAPATPGRDTLAVLSAIVGGLSLCAAWFPVCGPVLPLVGLAMGAFSLGSRQRTIAIVGIALGVLGLLMTVISLATGFYTSVWTSFWEGFQQGYSSGQ